MLIYMICFDYFIQNHFNTKYIPCIFKVNYYLGVLILQDVYLVLKHVVMKKVVNDWSKTEYLHWMNLSKHIIIHSDEYNTLPHTINIPKTYTQCSNISERNSSWKYRQLLLNDLRYMIKNRGKYNHKRKNNIDIASRA